MNTQVISDIRVSARKTNTSTLVLLWEENLTASQKPYLVLSSNLLCVIVDGRTCIPLSCDTWWRCKRRRLCLHFAFDLSAQSILQTLCLYWTPSISQTNRFSDWQKLVILALRLKPGKACRSCWDISSPSHCWRARSYAASSLAWLAWKADGLLGGRDGFPHMHSWLTSKVWSLPTFFAEA